MLGLLKIEVISESEITDNDLVNTYLKTLQKWENYLRLEI